MHPVVQLVPVERRDAFHLGDCAGKDDAFRRRARRVRIVLVRRRAGVDLGHDEPERMLRADLRHALLRRPDLGTVVPLPSGVRVVGRLVQPARVDGEDVAVLPASGLVHRIEELSAVDESGEAEGGDLDLLLQLEFGACIVERLQPALVPVRPAHCVVPVVAAEIEFIADLDDRAVPFGGFREFLLGERDPLRLVCRLVVQVERQNAAPALLREFLRLGPGRRADPPHPHARQETVAGFRGRHLEVRGDAHDARLERLVLVGLHRRHIRPHEGIGESVVEFGVHEPVFAFALGEVERAVGRPVRRQGHLERGMDVLLPVEIPRHDAAGRLLGHIRRIHHRNREMRRLFGRIEQIEVGVRRDLRRHRRASLQRARHVGGIRSRQQIHVDDVRVRPLALNRDFRRRRGILLGALSLHLLEILARRRHDDALGVLRRQLRVAQGFRHIARAVGEPELLARKPLERPDRVVGEIEPPFRHRERHQIGAAPFERLPVLGLDPHAVTVERRARLARPHEMEADPVLPDGAARNRAELGRAFVQDNALFHPQTRTALRNEQRVVFLDARIPEREVDADDGRVKLLNGLHLRPVASVLVHPGRRVADIGVGQRRPVEFEQVVPLEVADDGAVSFRHRHKPVLRRGPLRRHLARPGARRAPQRENQPRQNPSLHVPFLSFRVVYV